MKTKRGVIIFLVLGILIFSSVSLVSAQEPGAGYDLLGFLKVRVDSKGNEKTTDNMQDRCSNSCDKYDGPSDKLGKCLIICEGRSRASRVMPSLALCEYILGKAEKGELNSYVTNKSKTPEEIYKEMESRGDYSSIPFSEFGEYQTQFPQGITYDEEMIIRSGRYSKCLSKLRSLSESEDGGLCASCEKIESREAKEECYYECQREDKEPTETAVPGLTNKETPEDGNYEKGGTLKEWKERLQSETGPDSDESKTAAACEALMKQKTAECSQHGGWRTHYMMEIADFRTDEHYEFQDIRGGGCPNTSVRDADTTNLYSQAEGGESAYQVVCSVLCSSWSCDVSSPAVGTEVGEIKSLKGKVKVRQSDDSWKEVDSGTSIYLNDNIRTGKDGKIAIKLADDTVFTIGKDSDLVIDEFVYDPNTNIGTLTASLSKGIFRFVTGKMIRGDPSAHIKFRLHDFVIGVRGTDLILSYDPDTKTSVLHLYEGKVDITQTSTGNKEEFNAGQTVFVEGVGIAKTSPLSQEKWISLVEENELDEESSSSFFVNSFILIILIVGAVLIIRKIKKRKDSKTVKKQSVEHKKSEISGETKKWGIASLILAILSILFLFLPFVGIILAILAVVFAIIQKKHNSTKIATAGLVIGIIGIVFNITILIAGSSTSTPNSSTSTSAYFDRATLQCETFCDSKELFLAAQVNITGDSSLYNCICIKDFGEPYQKVVGSRTIITSKLSEDEKLIKQAEPYIDAVKTSDVNIRAKAGQIVKDCPSGDRECSVNAVYRYITEELRYVHDPKGRQIIQTPEETLAINGGDCEDLSILINSYLENLGVETATVLTPDHAYAAACNLNTAILQQYAAKSLNDYTIKQWTKSISADNDESGNYWNLDFVTIDDEIYYKYTPKDPVEKLFNGPGSYWSWAVLADFNTSYFESVRIDYKVRADDNIDFYVLKSEGEVSRLKEGKEVEGYEDCGGSGVSFSGSCKDMKSFGGIGLVNGPDSGKSRVTIYLTYYLKPKPENQFKTPEITTYNLNMEGVQCIVLDPTQGPDGYPGSDRSVNATRVMVTNIAKEVKDFGFLNYCTSNNYC